MISKSFFGSTQSKKDLECLKNFEIQPMQSTAKHHMRENAAFSSVEEEPVKAEHAFAIAEDSLISGLTQDAVKEATVVELYYLVSSANLCVIIRVLLFLNTCKRFRAQIAQKKFSI